MYSQSKPKGWITRQRLAELCELFTAGSLDAKSLVWKIYENYVPIRGEEPDQAPLCSAVHRMHRRENAVRYIWMRLILENGIIVENPRKEIFDTNAKTSDELEFEKRASELY
jgi:hypothetical protein